MLDAAEAEEDGNKRTGPAVQWLWEKIQKPFRLRQTQQERHSKQNPHLGDLVFLHGMTLVGARVARI